MKFTKFITISIIFTLVTGCATTTSNTFNIRLHGMTSYYGRTNFQRGELIDAIPIGRANPGPMVFKLLSSTSFKNEIGSSNANLLQELVLDNISEKALNEILMYRIHYWSQDINQRPISLSALLLLPVNLSDDIVKVPLIQINHSTALWPNAGPSKLSFSENIWAYLLSSTGSAIILPDYPGYGDSETFHPYCLAKALGYSGRDAIEATVAFFSKNLVSNLGFNGNVSFAGYSEGGYASLSTVKEIANNKIDDIKINLLIPMAAPTNISNIMRSVIINDSLYPNPFYLPFLVLGWRQVDQELFAPERVFKPWVFNKILPLISSYNDSKDIDKAIRENLGNNPLVDLLSEKMKNWIMFPHDSLEGIRLFDIMRNNDLSEINVSPEIKVIILHSPNDDAVPFENSELLYASLIERKNNVTLIRLETKTHNYAFLEAWIYAFNELLVNKQLYQTHTQQPVQADSLRSQLN